MFATSFRGTAAMFVSGPFPCARARSLMVMRTEEAKGAPMADPAEIEREVAQIADYWGEPREAWRDAADDEFERIVMRS